MLPRLLLQLQRALIIVVQLGVVVLSNRLAFMLRFDGDVPDRANEAFWLMLPWLVGIRALTFIPFKLYEGLWRHTSIYDLRAIAGSVIASSGDLFSVHADAARSRDVSAVHLRGRRVDRDAAPWWRAHGPSAFHGACPRQSRRSVS